MVLVKKNIIFLTGLFHFLKFFSSFSHRTSECLLFYYIHSYERRCNNVMLKNIFVSFLHKGRPEFRNHVMRRHSSEIICLCLMKFRSKMLQNWPYFWNTVYKVVFVFPFSATLLFPEWMKMPCVSCYQGIYKRKGSCSKNWKKIKKKPVCDSYSKKLCQNLKGFSRSFRQP